MASAADGWETAYASNGVGNTQESAVPQPHRRHPQKFPARNNPVTRIGTNGKFAPLTVQTNSSGHAVTLSAGALGLNRRDYLPTNSDWFNFTGIDGLKVTAHVVNGTMSTYGDALRLYAGYFADSAQSGTVFGLSDSWIYQVCNSTNLTPLFSGRITVEQSTPGFDFEDLAAPDCASDLKVAQPKLQTTTGLTGRATTNTHAASSATKSYTTADLSTTESISSTTGSDVGLYTTAATSST
ncbi:hypothetical protein LTR35_012644 [Friedmanniomyces endolithicus]|nr:hypothetical protein LTS00_017122 [Friedmanniomyces endolithicus]KAK0272678.1 hypothetical protein LTR35_012644 [Friedmanniomyces endolithicus]KAK0971257.1 hypothetical protein LTR54_017825 [Friedmanniomyces endolithicus]